MVGFLCLTYYRLLIMMKKGGKKIIVTNPEKEIFQSHNPFTFLDALTTERNRDTLYLRSITHVPSLCNRFRSVIFADLSNESKSIFHTSSHFSSKQIIVHYFPYCSLVYCLLKNYFCSNDNRTKEMADYCELDLEKIYPSFRNTANRIQTFDFHRKFCNVCLPL